MILPHMKQLLYYSICDVHEFFYLNLLATPRVLGRLHHWVET